jgi:RNA recognition motif-containing protein
LTQQGFGKLGLRGGMARPWGQKIGSNDKHNEWKLFIGQVPLEVGAPLACTAPAAIVGPGQLAARACLRSDMHGMPTTGHCWESAGKQHRLMSESHGLPVQATEEELFGLFSPIGEILELYILRNSNGKSRGCAFVTYANKFLAQQAITQLNGKQVHAPAPRLPQPPPSRCQSLLLDGPCKRQSFS